MHLVLDGMSLQVFSRGEWDAEMHGHTRRRWCTLHPVFDGSTGEIAAHALTDGHADDAARARALLRQVEGCITSVTADGAHGCEGWQRAGGHGRRDHIETAMGRHKHLIASTLRARTPLAQQGEAAIVVAVLDQMVRTAKPASLHPA